jgi:hypothetical protein
LFALGVLFLGELAIEALEFVLDVLQVAGEFLFLARCLRGRGLVTGQVGGHGQGLEVEAEEGDGDDRAGGLAVCHDYLITTVTTKSTKNIAANSTPTNN